MDNLTNYTADRKTSNNEDSYWEYLFERAEEYIELENTTEAFLKAKDKQIQK